MAPSHTPGQCYNLWAEGIVPQRWSLVGSCLNGSGMMPVLFQKSNQRGTQDAIAVKATEQGIN